MTIVEIKDLDFAYNGENVLEDVNLTVRQKDFMAIIGPNGGGKTTLLKLVLGLLAMSYDEEFARIRGVRVKKLYFGMIGMLAVAIVLVIQVVGLILVIALLTIPPFIVEKYANALIQMMVASSLLGALFTVTGLWISYQYNLTSGASIIMVSGIVFLISLTVDKIRAARQ